MKIFINTTNWAIVKTENEFPSVVGDNYVDTLKVYYDVNPSTALIYPTITLLKPNGRKVGAFPFDAGTVEDPVPFTYTDADSNTWYGFAFTLSSDDGQLTSVGRYQVTITTNKYKVVGTAPNESQVITNQRNTNIQLEVMNAVLNDNSDILILGESVDDVVASMYQLCQTLELDFASLTNSKADRSNTDQTILARLLKASNIEAQTTSGILTIGRSYADISLKSDGDNHTDSFVNIASENDVNVNAGDEVNINGTTIDLVSAGEEVNAEIYMNNESVTISGYQTTINHLRVMQPDGLGGDITVSGNNATEVFTNDGLNIQSKTKIGNTSGDYWQFYGDTLSLKGSSHTIESNSGDAAIVFDNNELGLGAENKVQVNAPTVNVDGNTVVLGDEPTSGGGGGIVINPTYSPSCLKVIKNATGSNAVVQVKTATDKIPFEITKNGNVKFLYTSSGTAYDWVFNGGNLSAQKTPSGGSTTTIMALNPEQGLIVKNDLLDVDPSQYMTKYVTPFRVGIKTGGTNDSTTGTYVSFNNSTSQIDFKTANTLSDSIYMNGVKLTNKTYVDSQDNNLQSQIDGLNAGQNLADIVADLTALNNLDTTNLKNGDKVQVLVDSNHDNASTVYSLVINGNTHSWSYIGKYGQDGYTKAEANALLALKADLTNTSQTITTDKVKVNEIQPNQGGFLLNADTVAFKSYTSQGVDYPAGTYQWVQSGADLVLGKNNSNALIALSPVGLVADTPDMLMNPQTFKSKTGALNIGLYNNEGMHNDLVGTTYGSNYIISFVKDSIEAEEIDYSRIHQYKDSVQFDVCGNSYTITPSGFEHSGGVYMLDTANATTELFLNNTERASIIAEIEEVFA